MVFLQALANLQQSSDALAHGGAQLDRDALEAIGATLSGTGRPLVIASGVLGLAGRVVTEQETADPNLHPRIAASLSALALADRGVRTAAVRFAPIVRPGFPGVGLLESAMLLSPPTHGRTAWEDAVTPQSFDNGCWTLSRPDAASRTSPAT